MSPKIYLTAVLTVELAIIIMMIIQHANMYVCVYNIDDLYHTWRIDPPGVVKIVYNICTY